MGRWHWAGRRRIRLLEKPPRLARPTDTEALPWASAPAYDIVYVAAYPHADQFKDTTHEVVIWPNEYKSGDMISPYSKAKNP